MKARKMKSNAIGIINVGAEGIVDQLWVSDLAAGSE